MQNYEEEILRVKKETQKFEKLKAKLEQEQSESEIKEDEHIEK